MSYPNVSNYIHTNKVNIDELKLDIIESAKTAISDERFQVVENLTQNITRAMGDFWFSVDGTIPAGGLPHLGHLVSRELYSDFYIWLEGNKTILSDEEWLAYANSHGGCCPYYSSGDGSTTFRTPSYPDTFLKMVSDENNGGLYEEAGLPNITGQWTTQWNVPARGFHALTTSGCFYDSYPSYNGTGRIWGSDENNGGTRGFPWFDASRSNAIYGKSNTVTPKNIGVIIGVYAVGAIVPVGVTDAEKLMNNIIRVDRLLDSKVDKTSPYITEHWSSGTEWYRVWSNGWIEQGGQITGGQYSSPVILTFHKAFIDTNYTINAVVVTSETGNWTRTIYFGVKSNSTIKVVTGHNGSSGSSLPISWYACGY